MGNLKARLRQLDRLETPDVWERATRLEPSSGSEADLGTNRTSKRIVAGLVAAAVFIASGAFAWQIFRSNSPISQSIAVSDSIDGSILWPERTGQELRATQAQLDAGDPGLAWRLDPKEVATRFAEQVLAWGEPDGRYVVSDDLNDSPPGPGIVELFLSRYAIPCPPPTPGTQSYCPPPFQGERLTLRQMVGIGDGGVWSVTEVHADGLSLKVAPGDVIAEGGSITGSIQIPEPFTSPEATPRVAGNAGIRIGTDDGCPVRGTTDDEYDDFSLDASIPAQFETACGAAPAGYVWAAIEPYLGVAGYAPDPDPLYASTKEAYAQDTPFTVYALTAVPITVSQPSETAPPTAPPESTSSAEPTNSSTSEALTSSTLLDGGAVRCTATFPNATVEPGHEFGVTFEETNVSDGPVKAYVGVNGDAGWLLIESDGQLLLDTSQAHVGIMGPPPIERTVGPGGSVAVEASDARVIWPGPLQVTPVCEGKEMSPVTIEVSVPAGQPDPSTALDLALADTAGAFDQCMPAADGSWVTGTAVTRGQWQPNTFDARCAAWISQQPGFDVIVLAIVAPPDAPEVDLSQLPGMIQAVPELDVGGAVIAVSWWVSVVTTDGVTLVRQTAVTQCRSSNGYGTGIGSCGDVPSG